MDNVLIEVVIGLLLIYIAMAFLLMKLQESLHGGVRRGRVQNMHLLLLEACGQDADLKQRLLAHPLILGLSTNKTASQEGKLLRRPTGPSAVPADLFAKALLTTLNPSGQLPSSERLGPLAFMDFLLKNEAADTARARYLQGLRALVPEPASGWPAFEMAIATWYSDIGDRADGWYKRRSSLVGTYMALALCALLNVDTANIINSLGGDADLRQSLGRIADLVLQQRNGSDKPAAALGADPALDPGVRAIARLVDANAQISEAYAKDKAITRFGFSMTEVRDTCPGGTPPPPGNAPDLGKYVSNSDSWVSILPALLPKLDNAINRVDSTVDAQDELRATYRCLSHVSAWVRAASTASNSVDTRRVMLEAGKALEDSKGAILAVLHGSQQQGGLRRLFRQDPDAFVRCAATPGASTATLQACVLREQDLMARLPIGHGAANWRQQFCTIQELGDTPMSLPSKVLVAAAGASAVTVTINPASTRAPGGRATVDALTRAFCGTTELPPQSRLGTPGMALDFSLGGVGVWIVGVVISALFISLGAPILFDILGNWVKLRNAGPVRDSLQSAVKGGGTLALPMLAGSGSSTSGEGAAVLGAGTLPGVEGARAGVEEQLSPREVQALKQRLGIQPSTGGFDEATRTALKAFTQGSGELTWAAYYQLMNRPAVQAGQIAAPPQGNRAQLRQPFLLAPSLANNLNTKLGFPGRVPATETTFSDELRALAVLYRFRAGTSQGRDAPVFDTVLHHPEQLDQIDEALLNQMLDASPPFATPRFAQAPWLDIALGELGQVESNGSSRATSNPRVCAYLDATSPGKGDGGDTIPWCAAFVTWVLNHPCATNPANGTAAAPAGAMPANWVLGPRGFLQPATDLALAARWKQWQRPGAAAAAVAATGGTPPPQVGDVVVVNTGNGKQHVGFVFEVDMAAQVFWMLGGNQDGGTRVCLSRWLLASIA